MMNLFQIADSLCLGPAPERQRRIKKTKLKTLIVDKKTQLDNNQMIANLRSKVETVDIEVVLFYKTLKRIFVLIYI